MDRPCLERVVADREVVLLVQFGSTVTGATHARSDIDLAVLLPRPPESYAQEADLQVALQSCMPEREVDLVILNRADPLLLKQITENGCLLYGNVRRWQEFRAYAFRRYQDHRRFLQMERDYVQRAIGSQRR